MAGDRSILIIAKSVVDKLHYCCHSSIHIFILILLRAKREGERCLNHHAPHVGTIPDIPIVGRLTLGMQIQMSVRIPSQILC